MNINIIYQYYTTDSKWLPRLLPNLLKNNFRNSNLKNNAKDKLKRSREERRNKLDVKNSKDSSRLKDKKRQRNKELELFLKNSKTDSIFLEKSKHSNQLSANSRNNLNGTNSLISITKVMIQLDPSYQHSSTHSDSSHMKDLSKLWKVAKKLRFMLGILDICFWRKEVSMMKVRRSTMKKLSRKLEG